jgi:hydrogenase small subunit
MKGAQGRHGLHYAGKIPHERFSWLKEKTFALPGCPVQPEVLAGTLDMIASGAHVPRDGFRRPKAYYAYTVHNGCTRNEYFEYKIDDHSFGELEGCMFYDHGCQATYAHGSCNKILWNGVNSKTRIGQPCMGCTEADFPITDLWKTRKNMGIPAKLPAGIPKRVYLSLAGVAKAFRIERFCKRLMDEEQTC